MDRNQITELFKYRRTALALECLYADGPMRWTDIGHAMSRRGGEWIEGKAVTRPLQALQRLGLVADDGGGGGGNHLYALTPLGVELARQIQELAQLDGHRDDDHPHEDDRDDDHPDEPG